MTGIELGLENDDGGETLEQELKVLHLASDLVFEKVNWHKKLRTAIKVNLVKRENIIT